MKSIAISVVGLALVLSLSPRAIAGLVKSIPVGNLPTSVAVNQTTNTIYVSNLTSDTVSVIDGVSDTVVATVSVGSLPEVIDVNPITNMVYVANFLGNSLSVIDGGSNSVVATITGLSAPFGVSVDSVTNQVLVSNSTGANYVAVIDGATNTISATIPVGNYPYGVRVNSVTGLAYVANELSGTVSVIDIGNDSLANTFSLPQGAEPFFVGADPTTNRLFVVSANAAVYVLDASSGALVQTVTGGKSQFKTPAAAVMFEPGKSFLVSDTSLSDVTEFSETTYNPIAGLKGGDKPCGIAVNRKTGKIYVAENGNGTVNAYSQSAPAKP